MADEIELKFDVAPLELRKLKVAWARSRRPKEEKLVSVYFDTPKHKLERNGISLRVRHCGNKRLQTIKSAGAKAFLRRAEWEHEIRGDFPNLRKARGTALEPFLTRKLHRRLTPIFETRVHRTSVPVRKNRGRIEVALDEGRFALAGGPLPLVNRA